MKEKQALLKKKIKKWSSSKIKVITQKFSVKRKQIMHCEK